MSSEPLRPRTISEETRIANLRELQTELETRGQRDRAYLIVLAGTIVGEMRRVENGETVIGRAQNVNIRLNDDGISRRHARLVQTGAEVVIEDRRGSAKRHAGERGDDGPPSVLQDGDKIRIGSTTICRSLPTTIAWTRASSSRCTTPRSMTGSRARSTRSTSSTGSRPRSRPRCCAAQGDALARDVRPRSSSNGSTTPTATSPATTCLRGSRQVSLDGHGPDRGRLRPLRRSAGSSA